MKTLLALYLMDYNGLTRPEKARLAWYAWIILAPLAALIAAHLIYGPGPSEVMGW